MKQLIEYVLQANDSLMSSGFPGFIHIAGAIVIILLGRWLARHTRGLFTAAMAKTDTHVNQKVVYTIEQIIYYGIFSIAISFALIVLGVPINSIILFFGLFLVLVGLAFQTTLNNLAATIIFVVFQTYKPGDWIDVLNGTFGQVKRIQLFTTVILTQPKNMVTIPNGVIMEGNIINYSELGYRRVDIAITITYESDLMKAKQIMEQILAQNELVLDDPKPVVGVENLSPRGVEFYLWPFTLVEHYYDTLFAVTEEVKLKLMEAGITIPVLRQDVKLIQPESVEA
ncbi:MAG: mechanosensitive ion channel family protein [Anaerolineae bacterium]|nr:mechanosensitive ion channel family protein [Anaerolineae bacterium]